MGGSLSRCGIGTRLGRLMNTLSDLSNVYLFVGRRYIPVEEVYDFRSRSYNPSLGHFFQRDPNDLGEAPNIYGYSRNNVLTFIDPY